MSDVSVVYNLIIDSIKEALKNASVTASEPKIVENSITIIEDKIKNKPIPHITARTKFCHQKPYAYFIDPSKMFGKTKTELGDYLLVCKYKSPEGIIDQRALFLQAKKAASNFHIEKHQLQFYLSIDNILFKFGNRLYKNEKNKPIVWRNISTKNDFGDYMLMSDAPGNVDALDVSTHNISHSAFSFPTISKTSTPIYICNKTICCDHPLIDFLSLFGKGTPVKGCFKEFIELIYKKLGMEPDPSEENEGFWEEEKRFGLIEVTFSYE
jgi:hypothetical protein